MTLTQGGRAAEFILSKADGNLSFENGVAGETLPAGEVVKITADKLVSYNGTGTVVGIVRNDCVLEEPVAYFARLGEVKGDLLTSTEVTDGSIDTGAIAGLLALDIVVR